MAQRIPSPFSNPSSFNLFRFIPSQAKPEGQNISLGRQQLRTHAFHFSAPHLFAILIVDGRCHRIKQEIGEVSIRVDWRYSRANFDAT